MADEARGRDGLMDAVAVSRRASGAGVRIGSSAVAALLVLVALAVFSWPLWECAGDAQACLATGFLAPEAITAWLDAAARIGIVGAAVCLMIVAGEYDLSVGATAAAAGLVATLGMSELGLAPLPAALLAIASALLVGLLNGWIVTRSHLPSLVVTLGTHLLVQGATLAAAALVGDRAVGPDVPIPPGDPVTALFSGSVSVGGIVVGASVLWSLLLTALAAWLLTRTTFGNWILGTGGSRDAAWEAGVPVRRVRGALFMLSAASAAILGLVGAFAARSDGSAAGLLAGEAIAASAVGGTLLTGGAGSPIGMLVGALALGLTQVGIPLAGLAPEWYAAVVGCVILVAAATTPWARSRILRTPTT